MRAIIGGLLLLLVLIALGFALGIEHSQAQTVIDWRTVQASITHTRTPQPVTPTATMDTRYTWTPSPPFIVRTGIPRTPATETPVEIPPIYIVTVEVTREVTRLIVVTSTPFVWLPTATLDSRDPVLPEAQGPIVIPTLEGG